MADGIPTDPPNSRTLDYGALVRKAWGDEWHKHEKVYQVGGGRTFESSDYGTSGIYGATPTITYSGTSTLASDSSLLLDSNANGGGANYVGKAVSIVRSAFDTATSRIISYNEFSKSARLAPVIPGGVYAVVADGTRTNLILRSQEFDTIGISTWGTNAASVTANAGTAPDGSVTADKLIPNTSSSTHSLAQANIGSVGVQYSDSVYAKADGNSWLIISDQSGSHFAYFNITAGTTGTVTGATASIVQYPNSWFRCTVTYTIANKAFGLFVASADNNASFAGDGTSGVLLWGAQREAGSTPSPYIATTTAAVSRAADGIVYSISP